MSKAKHVKVTRNTWADDVADRLEQIKAKQFALEDEATKLVQTCNHTLKNGTSMLIIIAKNDDNYDVIGCSECGTTL